MLRYLTVVILFLNPYCEAISADSDPSCVVGKEKALQTAYPPAAIGSTQVTVISETDAIYYFNELKKKGKIPYNYVKNGCFARAMAITLNAEYGIELDSKKDVNDSESKKEWTMPTALTAVITDKIKDKSKITPPPHGKLKNLDMPKVVLSNSPIRHWKMAKIAAEGFFRTDLRTKTNLKVKTLGGKETGTKTEIIESPQSKIFGPEMSWSYHIAPVIYVKTEAGKCEIRVFDLSLFNHPISKELWQSKLLDYAKDVDADLKPELSRIYFGSRFQIGPISNNETEKSGYGELDLMVTLNDIQTQSDLLAGFRQNEIADQQYNSNRLIQLNSNDLNSK